MHEAENDKERSNHLILGFFFLTGLTGLAYELVWIRLLILAFGSTQFAITTVLVVFMAGLALGSFLFGRIIDSHPVPLKVYAIIEVALGLYCILSPAIFGIVKSIYLSGGGGGSSIHYATFEPAQFGLSFAALIIPATLMGGTLPVLVKYLASASGRVGFHTAVPYAINTLGAVFGCLITGFFSLYILGVTTTIYIAGAMDIIIGLAVLGLFARRIALNDAAEARTHEAASPDDLSGPSPSRTLGPIILGSFALSGFASLAYEVLWTRVFSLVLGSSVYAFTIMLATFLAGIGFGSLLFAPVVDRLKRPIAWFGALEAVIGFSALFSILLYKRLPFILYNLRGSFSEDFWIFQLFQFFLCAAIMIIPTLAMGAIFPLVGRIYTTNIRNIGAKIGEIYFFNTTGSIFGAFAGGFILIPLLGVQKSVILIAALNICIAITLVTRSTLRGSSKSIIAALLTIIFIITALALPPWEKLMMTMGLYINPVEKRVELEDIIYYKEGINAIITVRKGADGTISYQANGKTEASSKNGKPGEAWSLLGHIPLLLHGGAPDRALLVGLGSGVTLGAMERYKLKSIDVVEIETAVVDAAGYFSEANFNALDDPRVKLHVTDGRNFVFAADEGYDIIVSAVSDPWISGVSNLFTYEYFDELKNKLNPGGVASLWFQNYRITPKELKIGLNTFASVFDHVSVWFHYTDSLDLIIIGSTDPHVLDMARLDRAFKDSSLSDALARIGIFRPMDLFDLFIIGDADLRKYVGTTVLNTDERPIYEFTLPKLLYMDPALGIETLRDVFAGVTDFVAPVRIPEGGEEGFYLALGKSFNRYSFRMGQSLKIFEHIVDINPSNLEAREYIKSLKKDLRSSPYNDISE